MSFFFSLEGGEGVGKTTQRKLLEERLPALFPQHQFVFTREPGGTPLSDKIREVILSDLAKDADGKTMFGLFTAARYEHMRRIIVPALAAGKVVVTDRFFGASYAYQHIAQDNPVSADMFAEHAFALEHTPNMTIIIDMDPQIAAERVAARSRRMEDHNHFDARPLEFHQRLRAGYKEFSERYPSILVDGHGSVEEVHEAIVGAIRSLLE